MVWPMQQSETTSAKKIFFQSHHLQRGNSEVKPKSIDNVKSIVSMARELQLHPGEPLLVLASLQEIELKRLKSYLPDMDHLIVLSPTVFSLLQIFGSLKKLSVNSIGMISFSVLQEEQNPSDLVVAQSLCFTDPNLETRAAELVIKKLRAAMHNENREKKIQIFEEKPGKFCVLDVEDITAKHNIKKFSLLTQSSFKEGMKQPVFVDPGFSMCSMKVSHEPQDKQQYSVSFYTKEISYSGVFNHDVVVQLRETLESWLIDLNFRPETVTSIWVSAPWLVIAAFISEELQQQLLHNSEFHYPDHSFGWNPVATCIQSFFNRERGGHLFIYLDSRKIYLSLVWN